MKIKIPFQILAIENTGFHIRIQAHINGHKARLILDTGASSTVFDKTRIANLLRGEKIADNGQLSTGLGTNSMQSQHVEIGQLKIGALELNHYKAIVLDLNHVNVAYEQLNLPLVDGIIGGDLFTKYKAVIDYAAKEMILRLPKKSKKKKDAKKKKEIKAKTAKKSIVVEAAKKNVVAAKKTVVKKKAAPKKKLPAKKLARKK